jgi:hypothetical protein
MCAQIIDSDEKEIPYEAQIAALKSGRNPYDPCLCCGQYVPDPRDKKYVVRVNAHLKTLKVYKEAMERRHKLLEAATEWPTNTKSLVGEGWAGWCPLDGHEMYANLQDYWECPACRLQIHSIAGGPNIMPLKGLSQFRLRGRDLIVAVDELPGCGGWTIKHDGRVRS